MLIKVMLGRDGKIPTKATAGDAGWDLYAASEGVLFPGQTSRVPLDIKVAIPEGYFGMMAERSSLGLKGIAVRGGIIDSGYRGDLCVLLCNTSPRVFHWDVGDRIAQLLILPVVANSFEVYDSLGESTQRGEGGFGSSGR